MQGMNQLLSDHDLEHKKSSITASFKNSIRMRKEQMDEKDISIGSSKLGGLPDMPDGWEFPHYEKGYLTFMAQINLMEAKPYDEDNLLPESGMLYLFYDAVEQPWGFDEDEGCFKVIYFDGDISQLKRREYPEENIDYHPLPAFKMSFENIHTISENPEELEFENEEEEENYWNFRLELMQPEDEDGNIMPAHYMLGEPMNIQNDVFEELYEDGYEPVLLFQIDSDEEDLGVMWGDSGMLYFCLEKEELINKQFDKVTFTLQCF